MRPDFTSCASDFLNHSATLYSRFVYHGPVHDIDANSVSPALITVQGCKELCGSGIDYYSWRDASNTITTWVLPIIGLLLQAPYESNKNWDTILLVSRWVGNPIASLSYLLWNIKVAGKCALMVDMATKYEELPSQGSEFSVMRDSLFILSVMNQYSSKPDLPPIEAERLLRLALFSNLLRLPVAEGENDLVKRRTQLAQDLREGRKKGVVPVFVSFLWFVFALALSIQLAFSAIGDNETAHNLAIGFVSGWLPIMVLASTVDRNVVSADAIETKLNRLVDDVRLALLDPDILNEYMRITRTGPQDFSWCGPLADDKVFNGRFFTEFSGQGRKHWHYGVAHPILAGIEAKFMARYGRDWLREGFAARLAIVVGSRNVNGLKMFDPRMVWQITSSLVVVGGSVGGAFIISYYTPTVGLGCRSGGHAVYLTVTVALVAIELLVWWLTRENIGNSSDDALLERIKTERDSFAQRESGSLTERLLIALRLWYATADIRRLMKNFLIRPLEAFNTGWFIYIVAAQTFGSYQTCDCLGSTWATSGGYIDFETYNEYRGRGVYYYWSAATILSIVVMSAGLTYIVLEYCTQSFLSTEDYGRAMHGLKQTRKFKRYTLLIRSIPNKTIKFGKALAHKFTGGRTRPGRRSLVWTKDTEGHSNFFEEQA